MNSAAGASDGLSTRRGVIGKVLLVLAAALFCTAPVPGDVGGCGRRAEPLESEAFFSAKAALDCARCRECNLRSRLCTQACASDVPTQDFPVACAPVAHDGQVCLRALSAANCGDYAAFVRDRGATVPNECNFCPREAE